LWLDSSVTIFTNRQALAVQATVNFVA